MIQMVQRGKLSAPQDFQDFLRVRLALANEYKATKTHAEKQETKRNMGKIIGTDQTEVQDICREFPKNMILTSERNERIKPITITYQHTDNFTDSV